VASGQARVIECAREASGAYPSQEFLCSLSEKKLRSINVLFRKIADFGRNTNEEQFKKVEGEIWEFKRGQIRIGCFQVGSRWILTHGFIKKQDKWPRTQIERAERIRKEHMGMLE
jgi:phage-related protein